jgi:hypothetical protein
MSKGKSAAYKIKHARLLLKANGNGPNWPDEQIADAVSTSIDTVRNIHQRLVEEGFEAALHRRNRATPPKPKRLDGAHEARLIALRCSAPPAGYAKWT